MAQVGYLELYECAGYRETVNADEYGNKNRAVVVAADDGAFGVYTERARRLTGKARF